MGTICKVCNNSDKNRQLLVREMMFGSEEAFTYLECSNCGCLQLVDALTNMEHAYPSNYYSFQKAKSYDGGPRNPIIATLSKKRQLLYQKKDSYALFKKGIVGRFVHASRQTKWYAMFDLMGNAQVRPSSRVLDVGCGTGELLDHLRYCGFTDLTGIDPYTREHLDSDVKILRKTLEDLGDDNKFDIIIFSHSLEHLPDQLATLRKASALLSRNGVCLIRMPIKTDYIWNRYGTNWVQIDAPRHYVIHTVKSFELLLKRTDLIMENTVFDSSIFQFFASEQYMRGIPLRSQESYSENPKKSIFNEKQIGAFEKVAKQLNRAGQGDQAAFCLRKKGGNTQ
jgi:2-polyprenyl-3-methyl-5-hydroxy-6-metoxy-1,4-benzoquinol methylase